MAVGTCGPPVRQDTIFRIASDTKPITAATVLALAAEGRLDLDEPVDRLLPELDALAAAITTLPRQLRRSLTWDQGHEMAEHARFTVDAGIAVYF